MKKRIETIKKNYKAEMNKTLFVVMGFVGGVLVAKGLRKVTAEKPNLKKLTDYGTPVLLSLSGLVLSSATEATEKAKYVGYGLTASGVFELIKVIPNGDKLLSGADETAGYYMENVSGLSADYVDLSDLPLQKTSIQPAEAMLSNLPDLGASEAENNDTGIPIQGLGFNIQSTADVDMSGII